MASIACCGVPALSPALLHSVLSLSVGAAHIWEAEFVESQSREHNSELALQLPGTECVLHNSENAVHLAWVPAAIPQVSTCDYMQALY